MRKYYLFILFAMTTVFAASLSSCKETDNEVEEFPNWQKTNEAYYDKKYAEVKQLVNGGAADWKVLRSWAGDASVRHQANENFNPNFETPAPGPA